MKRRGLLGVLFKGVVIATASTTVIGRAMLESNPVELSTPDFVVNIGCMNDFPATIDGVIYLADNTTYLLTSNIDIPKGIALSLSKNGTVKGSNKFAGITYTGTGYLFT